MPSSLSDTGRELVDLGLRKLDEAIDLIGEDAVVAYLIDIYRKQVAPLDIPFVPQSVETLIIDPLAEAAIGHLVRKGHAAIHKAPAPPAPSPSPDEIKPPVA